MIDEKVDLLDANGNIIGVQNKKDAHKTGAWHKSVHIYLINEKNEILLQLRAANKDIFPSVWDISVGGHVGAGEKTSVTASRELEEELGIKAKPEEFEYLTTVKEVIRTGNFISSEFIDVFLIRKNVTKKDITMQKSEVADFKFVKLESFYNLVKEKDKLLFPHYDEYSLIIPILKKPKADKKSFVGVKNCKVYCFSEKQTFGRKLDFLKSNIVYLKDEYYLLNNDENKIIVYDPDYAGWQFPNEILKFKNIKGICLGTTTASYIDEDLCKKMNIPVLNIPKYSTDSVAEYMVMLMFALAKKLPLQIKANFSQDFNKKFTQMQLKGKQVGIVGLGNIGLRFANICDGIGMTVSYWDRNKKNVKYSYKSLISLFKESDVIFVALSTNKGTTKIVTEDLLHLLKKTAILLSIGGTSLFNHNLVVDMLRANKLFGYGLEIADKGVFDFVGNAMVTSEYAWFTKESQEERIKLWVENIKSFL